MLACIYFNRLQQNQRESNLALIFEGAKIEGINDSFNSEGKWPPSLAKPLKRGDQTLLTLVLRCPKWVLRS